MHQLCFPITFLLSLIIGVPEEGGASLDSRRRKKLTDVSQDAVINIESANKNITLQNYHILEANVSPVEGVGFIEIELLWAATLAKVETMPSVSLALLKYLNSPAPVGPFNCISFIERLLGVDGNFMEGLRDKGWGWEEYISEQDVPIGDVVLLYNKSDLSHPRHMAIKYSEDLYLSKGGPASPFLLLTDMDEMQKLWTTNKVLLLSQSSSRNWDSQILGPKFGPIRL